MLSSEMTNQITTNFIRTMIPHHQAAIDMCQNLLRFTGDTTLQNLARNIIAVQTRGIAEMRRILATSHNTNRPIDVNLYNMRIFTITTTMVAKMASSIRSTDINVSFVSEMIPHHEGAVMMCENLLQYPIDPQLANVARNIIQEQSAGIVELKRIEQALQGR